jgi:hypothetical protein
MWHMEIVSGDEVVAEHSNVTVASKDLLIPKLHHVAQGYTACDATGEVIETVGGDHGEQANIRMTAEGLVIVRGLWAHYQDHGGPANRASGYYYGITDEAGRFTPLVDLPRVWDNPQLHRQWNLRWQEDRAPDSVAPPAASAVAEAGEPHTSMSSVVGALGPSSRGIIGG